MESQLLAATADDPTAWLGYADWLEEQGRQDEANAARFKGEDALTTPKLTIGTRIRVIGGHGQRGREGVVKAHFGTVPPRYYITDPEPFDPASVLPFKDWTLYTVQLDNTPADDRRVQEALPNILVVDANNRHNIRGRFLMAV